MRFYRGDPRVTYVRTYRVPLGRGHLPILHRFRAPVKDEVDDGFTLASSDAGFEIEWGTYDLGRTPLWVKEGLDYCGSDEAWLNGAVVGKDAPLVWHWSGLSSCCIFKGTEPVVGTATFIPVFTGAGMELVDSPMSWEEGSPIMSTEGLCVPYLCLHEGEPEDPPEAGAVYVYLADTGGIRVMVPGGGTVGLLTQEEADTLYQPLGGGIPTREESTLAATGSDQATAAPILTAVVKVTGADGTKGVILPDVEGAIITVWNEDGSSLQVWPPVGARIALVSTDNPQSMAGNAVWCFWRVTPTDWSFQILPDLT